MNVWSLQYIRDFLISCLLVIGGGHRGDVIRNMTLEEWNDRKIEENEEGNQVKYFHVLRSRAGCKRRNESAKLGGGPKVTS